VETISGLLQFTVAHLETKTSDPNEKGVTNIMSVSAKLTPEIAAVMGIRDECFTPQGEPRHTFTKVTLGNHKLRDVVVKLPHADGTEMSFYPEVIESFSLSRDKAILRLSMRIRFEKGRGLELEEFYGRINTSLFDFAFRSETGVFDWSGMSGKGKQVDMSGSGSKGHEGIAENSGPLFHSADAETCILCTRGVPLNEDNRHITEDALISCAAHTNREPAIPDAREMGQRRDKRRKTRAELGQESDAEIQRRMKAVEVEVVQ
jgi:hypothetical protein